jgi:Cys-tRNA(Pro)/Cys-tRNA(Cys) deacylase
MAATPATAALERAGIDFTVHTYEPPGGDDISYGEAVAAALEVSPGRVFKTLVATVDGAATVAIVPVTGTLALKALARARGGKKAAMADPGDAERLTGYVTGGISPFAQRRRLPVVADEALMEFETVFVSGGRRGIQVEVAPRDLLDLTGAIIAPIKG